jgi:hypothetical protein
MTGHRRQGIITISGLILMLMAVPASAASPRELLTSAAFQARDKQTALASITQSEAEASAQLTRAPNDREAATIRAIALGYKAKLTHSRSEALAARKLFEGLAAANPHDPEAIMAVGTWHMDSIGELGGFIAGVALGAHKATGLAAMDRAVMLGGNRAMFSGLAALSRLALDPKDKNGRRLAEAASRGTTPTALDQIMQRSAVAILVPLRSGNAHAVQALARQLLPLGRLKG